MPHGKYNRVAITGMGALCGLGHDLATVWDKAIKGQSGVSHIENISTEPLTTKIAGEVKNFTIDESILDPKEAKRFDLFIHYALHSSYEAFAHAGLNESNPYDAARIGCILGVGMGGFHLIQDGYDTFAKRGERRISPFFIPSIIPNMSTGLISIKLGLKGKNYSLSSACASAAHAISTAADEIFLGRQDVVITGGSESVICNLPLAGFTAMKATSKRNDDPTGASRPFDVGRDGFVMGEGAGILILENLEKAKARGATIYGEIVGHGANSDAHHIAAPHPEGAGAGACMQLALDDAGLPPEAIGYINAHGTSTPLGDIAETKAIKQTFGDHAHKLSVSSTKSMTAHLLGAAGGIESIFSVMALHEGIIPPTINLKDQDPECDLDYTANEAKRLQVEFALNNSFGFGGTNSSLIFKRYND